MLIKALIKNIRNTLQWRRLPTRSSKAFAASYFIISGAEVVITPTTEKAEANITSQLSNPYRSGALSLKAIPENRNFPRREKGKLSKFTLEDPQKYPTHLLTPIFDFDGNIYSEHAKIPKTDAFDFVK